MPHQTIADFSVWHTPMGSGPNKAVLIHCALGHSGAWTDMMSKLNDVLDAIAIDLPGHGKSGDWDQRGDYQTQVCAILAEMLEQPVDLIGHSFGATVALRLAVERPELVRRLILIEPVCFVVAKASKAYKKHMAEERVFTDAMMAGDRNAAARWFTTNWGSGESWEAQTEDQRTNATDRIHLIPETEPAVYDDVDGILAKERLSRVDIPVLLIDGADSPAIMDEIQSTLMARLPNARRVTISGAGHMVPITHAVEVAAEIRDFLT